MRKMNRMPPEVTPEILAQYRALTAGVGVAELADRTLLEVTGADRTTFLHSFTTSDVKKLASGHTCEAFVTSPQGKTLGHGFLTNTGSALTFDTTAGQAQTLIAHFDHYIISEDVTLRDVSSYQGELLIAISQAAEDVDWLASQIAREGIVIKRVGNCGPRSFLLQARRDDLDFILRAADAAGAVRCSGEAVEMARIEAGTPLFGRDITPDNLPQEIGRDKLAISFTKGCYLGQETVARIDALGHVNRLLAGVKFAGTVVPEPGTALSAAGTVVGHVTSAAWSPKLGAPLAIALLRRAQAKAGTTLTSPAGDAVVVPLPV